MKRNLIFVALVSLAAGYVTGGAFDSQAEDERQRPESSTPALEKQMRAMNDKMVEQLGRNDPNYERRFIDIMLPHHDGAIRMARDAMENSNKPELRQKAKEMIASQEKEKEQLRKWRREWYGE